MQNGDGSGISIKTFVNALNTANDAVSDIKLSENSNCLGMSVGAFATAKRVALEGLDFSKKGSVDEPIFDLIQHINSYSQYFTTSSCSGRTIIVVSASLNSPSL